MKQITFDWDAGNLHHATKRDDVTRAEIEFVLSNDPMVKPDPHPPEIEERWNAIGKSQSGREMFIVFMFREVEEVLCIRPISARFMHRKEIEKYDQENTRG